MPPDEDSGELVFFVDRCLGAQAVPEALRRAGASVQVHGDHFAADARDEDILALVGKNRWVFLSKDKRIRYRTAELQALAEAQVAAFISTSGNAAGQALGGAFAAALPRMRQLCRTHTRPLIGTVALSGVVQILLGSRRGGVRR